MNLYHYKKRPKGFAQCSGCGNQIERDPGQIKKNKPFTCWDCKRKKKTEYDRLRALKVKRLLDTLKSDKRYQKVMKSL